MEEKEVREAVPFNSEARAEVLKSYQEQSGQAPAEPTETTEAPAEAKPEETPAETAAAPKETAQDKPKEEKTVPYGALHEERLKRQTEQRLRKEAEARAKAFEDELARLKKSEPEHEEITDYEKELVSLRREQKAIKTVLEREQAEKEHAARQSAIDSFNRSMKKIDEDLEKEGYVGFDVAQDAVGKRVMQLIQEDEANRVLDTEEGWKKIYKEEFYPKMESRFAERLKNKSTEEKVALKQDAKLGNTPGKKPVEKKSPDDMSPEERNAHYMKTRRAMGV